MGFFDSMAKFAVDAGKAAGKKVGEYNAESARLREKYESYGDSSLLSALRSTSSMQERTAIFSVLRGRGYSDEDMKERMRNG